MLTGLPPFYTKNRDELFEKQILFFNHQYIIEKKKNRIKYGSLRYPQNINSYLSNLLDGLFTKNPDVRLGSKGVNEIKSHPWFNNINW